MYKLNYSINTKYKNTETEQHLMNYLPSSILEALDINHNLTKVEARTLMVTYSVLRLPNGFPSDLDLKFSLNGN